MIVRYVLGFMFSPALDHVVLIKKNKPKWQEGKLNGVGGKIEEYDSSPVAAMVREFSEETGVSSQESSWKHFGVMKGYDWEVECFFSINSAAYEAVSKTDEQVLVVEIAEIEKHELMSNLPWLINMCLDEDFRRKDVYASICYN